MTMIPAVLAALCTLVPATQTTQSAAPTTIVIVRHAEAVPDAGRDPVLSEAGAAHAAALAAALADADVAAVYATQYQRTQMTGALVAAGAKLQVTVRPIEGRGDSYVAALAAHVLGAHAGRTVVIVGHSNTVPALVKALSGVEVAEIGHDTYDLMFVVTARVPGAGSLVRARYGR